MRTQASLYALILAVAAGLRIPDLAGRPMHADEAIYAYQLGTLLETGSWEYDPGDYHGPVLVYVTAVPAWLVGAHRYVDLTETTLRLVPAVLGLLLVLVPLLFVRGLGRTQALAASALTAVSPAMVYYSRYYIPEMLLTCLTAALIAVGYRYSRRPKLHSALGAGLLMGLMFATKETALIAFGSLFVAALVVAGRQLPPWRHLLGAFAVALVVIIYLLGFRQTIEAFHAYLNRALEGRRHLHPWYYYLHLLLWWPQPGGPFWTEALILALAALGAAAIFRRRELPGGDTRFYRFLSVYTLSMTIVYALIPYKTPWCLLGFLHGMTLLAGGGLVLLAGIRPKAARAAVLAVVALCGVHLLRQAFVASRQYSADPQNPYVYAHTTRDVYTIRDRLEKLAVVHEEGRNLPVHVVSRENLWPLPWYLRSFPRVEWWRDYPDEVQPAPVILISPDMESALVRRLYEVPPPGQRLLYADLFRQATELRPSVELRGYVRQSLWDAYDRTLP